MIATGSLDSAKVVVITGNLNRDDAGEQTRGGGRDRGSAASLSRPEKTDLSADAGGGGFSVARRGRDPVCEFVGGAVVRRSGGRSKLARDAKRPLAGSIGPQTSDTMKAAGLSVDFAAKVPSLDALVDAAVKKFAHATR